MQRMCGVAAQMLYSIASRSICASRGGFKLPLCWSPDPAGVQVDRTQHRVSKGSNMQQTHEFSLETVPFLPQCLHVIKLCRTWMFYILELQHNSVAYLIMCCHALSMLPFSFFFLFSSLSVCSWVKRAVRSLEYFSHGSSYALKFKREIFSCTAFFFLA